MLHPERMTTTIRKTLDIPDISVNFLADSGKVRTYIELDDVNVDKLDHRRNDEEEVVSVVTNAYIEMIEASSVHKVLVSDHANQIKKKDALIESLQAENKKLEHYKIFYVLYKELKSVEK